MTKLLEQPEPLKLSRQFGLFDDFTEYTDTQRFTKTTADAGTSVALDADGIGGVLQLSTGATDNNEAYVESTNELFKFAADKPLAFEARLQFTEANVDDANVIVGVMDAPGADTLIDNGGGPKASYSGAVCYKVDGGTVWNCESSIAGAQQTTVTPVTAGGAGYQTLRIEFQPTTSTQGDVRFFINDSLVASHKITFTSATEMAVVLGVKAGSANAETLNVDYVGCHQLR
jgi:hypothetical protein